jgi:SAM-dependent methyltransferase
MLQEILDIIARKNPRHEKYLHTEMIGIQPSEISACEHTLGYFTCLGESAESIADKYLILVDSLLAEQWYFAKHHQYRYSTFEQVKAFYKDAKYMECYHIGLALSQYFWKVHRNLFRFYTSFLERTTRGGMYFEVGPGHGEHFVAALRSGKFTRYTGVDISETSVARTRNFLSYSLPNTTESYEILCENFFYYHSDEKANVVVMGEVLEHVEDPLDLLCHISSISADDALIYISTAINAPQLDHIYLFSSIDEIVTLFARAKLHIVEYKAFSPATDDLQQAQKTRRPIVIGFILRKIIREPENENTSYRVSC